MTSLPDLWIRHSKIDPKRLRFNLTRFAYVGGAAAKADKKLMEAIAKGKYGRPRVERVAVLSAIKEDLEAQLIGGIRLSTVISALDNIKRFFQFVDDQKRPCGFADVQGFFLDWAEFLFQRSRKKRPEITPASAYGFAVGVSGILDRIFEYHPSVGLMTKTRLAYKKKAKKALGRTAEKQNLEATFRMGHFLFDLVAGLTRESIYGPLPLIIPIRSGLVNGDQIRLWPGYEPGEWVLKDLNEMTPKQRHRLKKFLIPTRGNVASVKNTNRRHLVSILIRAEFVIFVAQTGMNKTQALTLRRERFKYKADGNSWIVRSYKHRAGGGVHFEIFKSYRKHFERYLQLIAEIFPDSEWVFPCVGRYGHEWGDKPNGGELHTLRNLILRYNIPWTPPQEVRNTRVNWLLRRSGDPDQTAEAAQHTKEILHTDYERPSQQRAMVEVTRFWTKQDPFAKKTLQASVVPGSACGGQPKATTDKPESVVAPNCVNPSGCLWCEHHRDSDSLDYVWSLHSFRHLKLIEATTITRPDEAPTDVVVNRLSEKIAWYAGSNEERAAWVEEARIRVEEGEHHPNWAGLVEMAEGL